MLLQSKIIISTQIYRPNFRDNMFMCSGQTRTQPRSHMWMNVIDSQEIGPLFIWVWMIDGD